MGGTAPADVYAVAVPVVANTGNAQADAATNAANVAAAVNQVRPIVERQLQDARDTLAAAERAVRAAVDAQAAHAAGSGFVYGAAAVDENRFMFKLDASTLSVVLPYTQQLEAEADAHRFGQHNTLIVPCTARYMFTDRMMSWNLNAGNVPIGTPPR